MKLWKTDLFLYHQQGTLKSNPINITCGIFQGGSLSPLLFCLSRFPLSLELNNPGYGYKIGNRSIDHLFFMDDLKLFAKNDEHLEGLLQTARQFSDDIGMSFGLDKCAKTFKRGKLVHSANVCLNINNIIRDFDQSFSNSGARPPGGRGAMPGGRV